MIEPTVTIPLCDLNEMMEAMRSAIVYRYDQLLKERDSEWSHDWRRDAEVWAELRKRYRAGVEREEDEA